MVGPEWMLVTWDCLKWPYYFIYSTCYEKLQLSPKPQLVWVLRKAQSDFSWGLTTCLLLGSLILEWDEDCTALKQALIEFLPLLSSHYL